MAAETLLIGFLMTREVTFTPRTGPVAEIMARGAHSLWSATSPGSPDMLVSTVPHAGSEGGWIGVALGDDSRIGTSHEPTSHEAMREAVAALLWSRVGPRERLIDELAAAEEARDALAGEVTIAPHWATDLFNALGAATDDVERIKGLIAAYDEQADDERRAARKE